MRLGPAPLRGLAQIVYFANSSRMEANLDDSEQNSKEDNHTLLSTKLKTTSKSEAAAAANRGWLSGVTGFLRKGYRRLRGGNSDSNDTNPAVSKQVQIRSATSSPKNIVAGSAVKSEQ